MILTKLKDFVGISEHDEYEEDYDEEMELPQAVTTAPPPAEEVAPLPRISREPLSLNNDTPIGTGVRNNVIGMPGINNSVAEVVVVEPHSFDEMPQVIQTLRERKSVVLNLNVMDPDEAQRAVDFVAGGTFAMDGHQERIGESIFLFTPNCVKVSSLAGRSQESNDAPTSSGADSFPTWGYETSRLAQ
ncbi:cell division protein SepF [Synechocystis salina LEGE 06099]|uniref:cell division protein SepF n=1 Tax=Synechocystis salina TaxID=945780 RepID=UPI0018810626|nr:cell division protein SepF [Synechocystis salina]MBE9202657.1 cell division protein SepF [Synechocystis salina LEGE 06099]